jgi:peptide methionine sulfoxide reductase msrA/msrB
MKIINQNLNQLEQDVIIHKSTEKPFSGEYDNFYKAGVFVCKNCNNPLYSSRAKFDAGCGWPAFEACFKDSVKQTLDQDGRRIEITCDQCDAHLGHVFKGERFTVTNERHCVNSVSIKYLETDKTIVGCGCFWGVQFYFDRLKGVVGTKVGYYGSKLENPTYEQVCSGNTGHYETIEIEYVKEIVSYEQVIKYFFAIHDFNQANGQGNDIGQQYKSVIFYQDDLQINIVENVIQELKELVDKNVATLVLPYLESSKFYSAELCHQDYYAKNGHEPYCHFYKKIFNIES